MRYEVENRGQVALIWVTFCVASVLIDVTMGKTPELTTQSYFTYIWFASLFVKIKRSN